MRSVFYSFHYDTDNWRVQQVRNMGLVEGQQILGANQWEEVKKGGVAGVQRWIDSQLVGKSCLVVLIGAETASRPWVDYEIRKAWADKKGILGVHIHGLLDSNGYQSLMGPSPFDSIMMDSGYPMSTYVTAYNPPFATSTDVYADIATCLPSLVEAAIGARVSA